MILHGNNFCYLLQAGRNWVFCLFVCCFCHSMAGLRIHRNSGCDLALWELRKKNVAVRVEKQSSNCSLSHVRPGGGGFSV